MINSILTIAATAFYVGIQRHGRKNVEWGGLMTFSLAVNGLIGIIETMMKCFLHGHAVEVEEIQKPFTIGFIAIVFATYQSFIRSTAGERKATEE